MRRALSVLLLMLSLAAGGRAETPTDPTAGLPDAVTKTLATRFPAEPVLEAKRDERNDYVYFTITLRTGEGTRRIVVREDGEITGPARP